MIPEIILQKALIRGFANMRKDSRIIDTILRNLSQTQLQEAKSFLLNSTVDFTINFPRKEPTLPLLALVLKREAESEAFLGDLLGDSTKLDVPMPEISSDTLLGHGASVSSSSGLPTKLAGPLNVESQLSSGSILLAPGQDITSIDKNLLAFSGKCLKLYVVEGSGAGEVYDIYTVTSDIVKIIGAFSPSLDSTSAVDIREPEDPELAVGEPSRVYSSEGDYYRKGVNYEVNYNLHILAGRQEQVIYLYSVVKALLLSQRAFIESQGILNLRIGGSDFAPRTEFLPDEVFQRVMSLQFVSPFDFIEELDTYNNIEITYWVEDDPIVTYPITL